MTSCVLVMLELPVREPVLPSPLAADEIHEASPLDGFNDFLERDAEGLCSVTGADVPFFFHAPIEGISNSGTQHC